MVACDNTIKRSFFVFNMTIFVVDEKTTRLPVKHLNCWYIDNVLVDQNAMKLF